VLWFERQVVGALMRPGLDAEARAAIESYVATTLESMPEYLRAGVAAETLALGARAWLEQRAGRLDDARIRGRLDRWKESRLDPIRQWVRLLESLVLFAENELAPEAVPA
jgi:hypothetical protein